MEGKRVLGRQPASAVRHSAHAQPPSPQPLRAPDFCGVRLSSRLRASRKLAASTGQGAPRAQACAFGAPHPRTEGEGPQRALQMCLKLPPAARSWQFPCGLGLISSSPLSYPFCLFVCFLTHIPERTLALICLQRFPKSQAPAPCEKEGTGGKMQDMPSSLGLARQDFVCSVLTQQAFPL